MKKKLLSLILLVALSVMPGIVAAHQVLPAIISVTIQQDGSYVLAARLNAEALLAEIDPAEDDTNDSPNAPVYDELRSLQPDLLRVLINEFVPVWLAGSALSFDGVLWDPQLQGIEVLPVGDPARQRLSTLTFTGKVPVGATSATWQYDAFFGESAVRVEVAGSGAVQSEFLQGGEASMAFALTAGAVQSKADVALEYTSLGFTHILPKGLDHILFVLGIFLLSLRLKPLLYQVTAFTIAHSITLALSLYGVVSLSPSIVEPLIALSIVYVAVENIVTPELKPWRVWVVFAFGLLHGLGFAGVLTELGLPREEFVTALIAFNVGVELGQLTVIALAFLAVGLWFRNKPWYRSRIVIPGSLAIAATGLYWTVERVFF